MFTTFVAGYVPWIGASRTVEEARAAPHSRAILIDELEHEKPPIILDCEGDLEAFASQEDALNHAEPTDVKDGAYRAFDSEGRSGSCPSSPLGVIPSAESGDAFRNRV